MHVPFFILLAYLCFCSSALHDLTAAVPYRLIEVTVSFLFFGKSRITGGEKVDAFTVVWRRPGR